MEYEDCGVVVDLNVRAGTANVLSQRQYMRGSYSGSALSVETINLEKGYSHNICGETSMLSLMTDSPVKLTYMRDNLIITQTVKSMLVMDTPITDIIILAEEGPAHLSVTRLQ